MRVWILEWRWSGRKTSTGSHTDLLCCPILGPTSRQCTVRTCPFHNRGLMCYESGRCSVITIIEQADRKWGDFPGATGHVCTVIRAPAFRHCGLTDKPQSPGHFELCCILKCYHVSQHSSCQCTQGHCLPLFSRTRRSRSRLPSS